VIFIPVTSRFPATNLTTLSVMLSRLVFTDDFREWDFPGIGPKSISAPCERENGSRAISSCLRLSAERWLVCAQHSGRQQFFKEASQFLV